MLREGIMCDVSHFRRMVALLVMRCFPTVNADALLSMPFNPFFFLPSSLLTLAVIQRFNFFILYFTVLKTALNLSTHWKTINCQKSQPSIPILYLKRWKSMVFENGGRELIMGHFIRSIPMPGSDNIQRSLEDETIYNGSF